ncbi:DUF6603 domain-containing protein [Nannocystaceae bacterium ST9]
MTTNTNALARALQELEILLDPLLAIRTDPAAFKRLTRKLGWCASVELPVAALKAAIEGLRDALLAIVSEGLDTRDLAKLAAALQKLATVAGKLDGMRQLMVAAFSGQLPANVLDEFVHDLVDYLVVRWLTLRSKPLLTCLHVLGVVIHAERGELKAGALVVRSHGWHPRVDLAAFGDLLADPIAHLRGLYLPGGNVDDSKAAQQFVQRLAYALRPLIDALGGDLFVGLEQAPASEYAKPANERRLRQLSVVFPLPTPGDATSTSLSIDLEVLPKAVAGALGKPGPGLELAPVGLVATEVALGAWTLELDVAGSPGSMFVGRDQFVLGGGPASLRVDVRLSKGSADRPALVIGADQGTRVELGLLEVAGFTDLAPKSIDFGFGAAARSSKLVVAGGDGDSFLAELLGEGLSVDFDLGLAWSKLGGLSFSGGAGFEVTIPIGLSLAGVFTLDSLDLAMRLDAEHLAIDAGVVVGLALGPFTAVVDGVGLSLDARFLAKPTGNLGPIDLSLAFKPPTGIGLAIDAGFAKGGGFLEIGDHRYSGVLELELLEVGVTAAGVLVTRMPDGSPGWSLLLSLAARFPGIQLGFGFTLLGVGGLIGIHRGVDTDALAEGVRTGALAHLLFPDDPIGDAVELIAALESVFPVARGQYVFGPIAKLGWGTPTLLTLELGVILQLPEPLTISLLGSFEALLPTASLAILALRVDMAGTLDLTAGTLKIDAALRDSKVAGLTLTGSMAVRASFLDNPTFLISFGGFHPAFQPPADFPKLDRLAVSLDGGDEVRVRLAGYFALTSNTVQFGAEASFWAKRTGFTAEGGTSFDALIQLAPFGFTIGIKAWLTVSAGDLELLGVLLEASLKGPSPWHVAGKAYFKLLGFKTHLEIEATIGKGESQPSPARENLLERVAAALAEPGAWAALPPSGREVVRLVEQVEGALVVHPAGRISLRQRVAPIGVTLEHYGAAAITGPTRLDFASPTLGGDPTRAVAIDDWFAAAQFFELSKTEKLAAPSFESMQAGLILGDDAAAAGSACSAVFDHETIYVDADADARPSKPSAPKLGRGTLALALARAGKSAPREPSSFALAPANWTIRDAASGAVVAGSPAKAGWFDARAKLREPVAITTAARVLAPTWENS